VWVPIADIQANRSAPGAVDAPSAADSRWTIGGQNPGETRRNPGQNPSGLNRSFGAICRGKSGPPGDSASACHAEGRGFESLQPLRRTSCSYGVSVPSSSLHGPGWEAFLLAGLATGFSGSLRKARRGLLEWCSPQGLTRLRMLRSGRVGCSPPQPTPNAPGAVMAQAVRRAPARGGTGVRRPPRRLA
jgi:hypothetical protein